MASKKARNRAVGPGKAGFGSKTAFVLGLPRETSAKEVVAKGKALGIGLTEAHVYVIRSTARKSSTGRSGPKPEGKIASRAAGAPSKGDFVSSFGPDVPASTIMREAKKAGISLSKTYLYKIRATAGLKAARAKPSTTAASRGPGGSRSTAALEAQFLDAALDLGLARARELLAALPARLRRGL